MNFRNTLLWLLFLSFTIFTATSPHAAEPPLRDELKAMARMLGEWKMSWTTAEGEKVSGTATVTAEAGGTVVLLKAEIRGEDGHPGFTRLSVFHWQPETRTLAERHFVACGHGMNVLVKTSDGQQVWQGQGFGRDGKLGTGTTIIKFENNHSWSAKFAKVVHSGESLPDSPTIIFTRIK